MRRRVLVTGFVLGCLTLAACGTAGQGSGTGGVGFEAGDGSVTILEPGQRPKAPELAGETLDGQQLSTADFSGQVVVLNVWGSWCAPCRAEASELVVAAAELPDVAFVGINTRDLDPAPAQAFVRAFEVPYPNIYDPDGSLLLGFGQVPPKAIPSTIVIDKEGRVAARILGATTAATIAGVIEDVRG